MAAECWRCIEDEYLKTIVREEGAIAECDLCEGDDEKAFTAEDLAELIDPIMREHFEPGEQVMRGGADDRDYYEQEGDQLSHHVQEIIGQDLGFEDEIVGALTDEDVDIGDGEEPFFDDTQSYVSVPVRPYAYYEEWNYVLENLKHRRRFFSSAASALFERLFKNVEKMQWWNHEKRANEKAVWELPQKTEVFRARTCRSTAMIKDAFTNPFKHVGPPPSDQARAGRMNPEGVAVFYGALDADTCLAETRPALGDDTAVITLHSSKPLRVLDFTRLEDCYETLSYFQPDFTAECERGTFVRRLQRLISQPVTPGREADYLITQTMTEYLAHIHENPFDGILFKSVQRSGGTNIVLFANSEGEFPLTYVDKSFRLFSTRAIEYEHDETHVGLIEGELWLDREPEDEL